MSEGSKRKLLTERPGASTYPDQAWYEKLVKIDHEWIEPGQALDTELLTEITHAIYKECRLLDDGRFEDWLNLFTDECIYWLPGDVEHQNPALDVTWEIHDRRRLEDRVARLRTGTAYSQLPPTRTRHSVSNIEAWSVNEDEIRVRTNLIIHAFSKGVRQKNIQRTLPCMCGYVFVNEKDTWLIQVKQINLIDADQTQGNNSFFL